MKRVYADMVGDLFHEGHVEFLRQAREVGDELVVGVHSDDETEWYKWRPVMPLAERAALVRACPYVDRVIENTPVIVSEEWIRERGIDLVVHGDDMDEEALALWYPAATRMGIIRTVTYTDGISSRELRGGLGVAPQTSARVRSTRRAGDAHPLRKRSSIVRRRVRFEFFRLDPEGDRWRYQIFFPGDGTAATAEIDAQPRVPFRFVGRAWLKVADHHAELTAIYGDWRTPRPDWFYGDDRAVVAWHGTPDYQTAWGSLDEPRYGPGEGLPTAGEGVMM